MNKRWMVSVMCAMLLVAPAAGFGAEWHQLVEQIGNGSVNWSTGIIEAKGIGAPPQQYYGKPQARPMALRAAQMDAYRNLLEVTKGVRINATTLVKDFVVQSDTIMSRVDGLVKGAQVVKQEYMSDGTVEVTLHMSLSGELTRLVLPPAPAEPPRPLTPPTIPAPPPVAPPVAPPVPPPVEPPPVGMETLSQVFTGLVVDARGLSARPAMSPKVLDENGQEVYGSAYVSREFAVQQGMSGYAKDLNAAQSNDRVTANPLTVKGIKTDGAGRSDIVVSNADAAKVRGSADHLSFLKQCRVMIVVD